METNRSNSNKNKYPGEREFRGGRPEGGITER